MAATTRFRYTPYHPLTRKQIAAPLEVISPKWVETVNGNGTFSGAVAVPEDSQQRAQILPALEPDESWIIISTDNGRYPWNGVMVEQNWHPEAGVMSFVAQECRALAYEWFLGPLVNMTGDVYYSLNAVDQLYIAQQLIGATQVIPFTATPSVGVPQILYDAETSGKLRDLNFLGTDFKTAGQQLDSISQRDGGFEWTLEAIVHNDGLPILKLTTGYPAISNTISDTQLRRTQQGGNILRLAEPIKRTSAERITRQWATGAGQPPDQAFVQDSDPALQSFDGPLLREAVSNFNTVIERTTLASHARSIRAFYTPKANLAKVVVSLDSPDVRNYHSGDRVAFNYQDRVYDYDLPMVRIIERTVEPSKGEVTLTLDLNDATLPQVDAGGAV